MLRYFEFDADLESVRLGKLQNLQNRFLNSVFGGQK
jgi:hypothetical protein